MKKTLLTLLTIFLFQLTAFAVEIRLYDCDSGTRMPLDPNLFTFHLCGSTCDPIVTNGNTYDLPIDVEGELLLGVKHEYDEYILTREKNSNALANLFCSSSGGCGIPDNSYYPILVSAKFESKFFCKYIVEFGTIELCVSSKNVLAENAERFIRSGFSEEQAFEMAKINYNNRLLSPVYKSIQKRDFKSLLNYSNSLYLEQKLIKPFESLEERTNYQHVCLITARAARLIGAKEEAIKYYDYLYKLSTPIMEQKFKYAEEYGNYLLEVSENDKARELFQENLITMPNDSPYREMFLEKYKNNNKPNRLPINSKDRKMINGIEPKIDR